MYQTAARPASSLSKVNNLIQLYYRQEAGIPCLDTTLTPPKLATGQHITSDDMVDGLIVRKLSKF